MTHCLTQTVQSLTLPPVASLRGQTCIQQATDSLVFQEENGGQRDVDPRFNGLETLEAVLREAQCRLQLLEEQLDLPVIVPPKITPLS